MATYEHNALMQYIDETGNMHINYPATKAENVIMGDSDAQIEITARAKTSDVLYTLEEISACTDFTNKISGAKAVNELNSNMTNAVSGMCSLNYKIKENHVYYWKYGKVVIISGAFNNGSEITTIEGFLTLPFKPCLNNFAVRLFMCNYNGANGRWAGECDDSHQVFLQTNSLPVGWYHIHGAYICE